MTKPENIYYDIQINNFESSGSQVQPLRFMESRNAPLIKKASDYEMSVVRFEIDTYSLPTWVASIEPEQNNPNKMIESITLEYDGTVIQKDLIFIPTNKHIPVPSPPSPLQADSEYYHGNSFRHYCDLVNNALDSATSDLKAVHNVALANVLPPKLIWNENNTASILAQDVYYNPSLSKPVYIYFNRALYAKFTSFPADKDYSASDGKIYKLNLNPDYGTKHVVLDPGTGDQIFIKTDQEYSTISNWAAVASIVFTTNSLPVVASQLSEPQVYSNGSSLSSGSGQNYSLVISDMVTNQMCYKPNLYYVPSGEYRMFSMSSDMNINDINVDVYWKDKKGALHPFYLQSGASASIKLYFRLKK